MTQLTAIAALVALAVGLWIGHAWGGSDRAGEVAGLTVQAATLTGERDAAREAAATNAASLSGIKDTLRRERERQAELRRAADEELVARANRIGALEQANAKLKDEIRRKVQNDEDCNALARLPVCRGVVDGLWPQQASRPH